MPYDRHGNYYEKCAHDKGRIGETVRDMEKDLSKRGLFKRMWTIIVRGKIYTITVERGDKLNG